MRLALVADEFAAVAGGFHHAGEGFGGRVGHGGVGPAVKNDRGRRAAFHVMRGRNIFRLGAEALGGNPGAEACEVEARHRREHEGGVEEDEGVGHGADGGVFAGLVEAGDDRGGGDVAAGGAAAGRDAVRVEPEARGVGAQPADGGFGIGHAVDGLRVLSRGDAVVGGDGDHAARGEGAAVLLELCRRTVGPASAEKENDRGAILLWWAGGLEDVQRELGVADGLVDFGARALEGRRVGVGGERSGDR